MNSLVHHCKNDFIMDFYHSNRSYEALSFRSLDYSYMSLYAFICRYLTNIFETNNIYLIRINQLNPINFTCPYFSLSVLSIANRRNTVVGFLQNCKSTAVCFTKAYEALNNGIHALTFQF